ncbi:hypothetical protein B7463_g5651, partial [Scytalidium lignicola]
METILAKSAEADISWEEAEIATGVTSLEKLRTARISDAHDALAIIALGQSAAAFDLLTSCRDPPLILRYSLSLSQPWYEELSKDPSLNPVIIPSVLWDTVGCLIKRDVPVIKQDTERANAIWHTSRYPYDKAYRAAVHTMDTVATSPLLRGFLEYEISQMQTQVSMYRTAGLLLAHRLLNPIGTLDDIARNYAEDIVRHLSTWSASHPKRDLHKNFIIKE